jgi:transketolase
VLWDSEPSPDLILIASGSELSLALDAARRLADEGTKVRVVSMPCWELFRQQTPAYRDEVLPSDVRARLSVEAGVALGWKEWVGDKGDSVALDRFGASAPGAEVLERLGFSVDNVVARASALLERVS